MNKYEDIVNLKGRHIVAAARLQLVSLARGMVNRQSTVSHTPAGLGLGLHVEPFDLGLGLGLVMSALVNIAAW